MISQFVPKQPLDGICIDFLAQNGSEIGGKRAEYTQKWLYGIWLRMHQTLSNFEFFTSKTINSTLKSPFSMSKLSLRKLFSESFPKRPFFGHFLTQKSIFRHLKNFYEFFKYARLKVRRKLQDIL